MREFKKYLLLAGCVVIYSFGCWANQRGSSLVPGRPLVELKKSIEEKLIADSLEANFDLSLEARENAEFMLAPSFLFQQILTEREIITGIP